ncbi:MAG: FAD-dependent thymidylate synthase [Candidatus Methylomirabilota bacterium]
MREKTGGIRVNLAGMNVPTEILEFLPESEKPKATPEAISAAYAKISRSDKGVDELVKESIENIANARKSNEAIIYGMGHHSVADHVMFNLNIAGVSRLLAESIEKRRLAGYTEKSQRYVKLDGDYVKPEEFSKKDMKKFEDLVALQNDFYFNTYPKLLDLLKKKNAAEISKLEGKHLEKFLQDIEGKAKEDARYSLSLATSTQLGCSYTGQTAELAIRELKYGKLAEEREFAKLLYSAIVKKAPSIIQLTDPSLFAAHSPGKKLQDDSFKYTRLNLEKLVEKTFRKNRDRLSSFEFNQNRLDKKIIYEGDVTLLNSGNMDANIIAALLHSNSKENIEHCYVLANHLIENNKAEDFIKQSMKYIGEFDKVPREFETGGLIYEIVLSATSFAQLKRQRMGTLLMQDYNPELSYTIPPNIAEIKADKKLKKICDKSSELYYEFKKKYGKAAEYCLTNAHQRRVIFATNMRELYHISRMREDEHAQWDIREKAKSMSRLAKQVAPATSILLGGKHEFGKIIGEVYRK